MKLDLDRINKVNKRILYGRGYGKTTAILHSAIERATKETGGTLVMVVKNYRVAESTERLLYEILRDNYPTHIWARERRGEFVILETKLRILVANSEEELYRKLRGTKFTAYYDQQ